MEKDNPLCNDDKHFLWVIRCLMFFLVMASIGIFKLLFIDGQRRCRGEMDGRELMMVKQIVELEASVHALEEARGGR